MISLILDKETTQLPKIYAHVDNIQGYVTLFDTYMVCCPTEPRSMKNWFSEVLMFNQLTC